MGEANNQAINIDELMAKIRAEVARRRVGYTTVDSQPRSTEGTVATIDWSRLRGSLGTAEQYAQIGTFLPGWPRFGRVKRRVARLTARMVLYVSDFLTNRQRAFNNAVLQALNFLGESLPQVENRLVEQRGELEKLVHQVHDSVTAVEQLKRDESALLARFADVDSRVTTIEQLQREESQQRENELRNLYMRLNETEQRQQSETAQRDERINAAEHSLQGVQDQLGKLEQDEIPRLVAEMAQRHEQIQSLERTLAWLKTDVILQERRVTVLLEEARKRLPEPFDQEQLNVLAEEEQHRLDALYVSFEDQFRGTREEIKGRLNVYLPILKQASIGTEAMPILDVGCGRGEWLEVLQKEGLVAHGLDINRVLVEQCRQRGFEVAEGDVLAYLRSLPEASVGAVTGFHIIEHLPFDSFMKLLDETVRVLKPGGVAIFETPNPQNVLVGSCNFYLDPTHGNPLPSPTVKFLAEARGLCRVEVLNLHPFPSALQVNGSAVAERFNEYFYGPQDYAVIGWKV
jgi:SAM-dependent methyltransferase